MVFVYLIFKQIKMTGRRVNMTGKITLIFISILFIGLNGLAAPVPGAVMPGQLQNDFTQTDSLKADSLYRQALASIEQQDLQQAYHSIQAAIAANEDQADYWKLLLQLQNHAGEAEEAAQSLKKLITLEPSERQHHLDLGFIYAYMGDFDAALSQYDTLSQTLGKDDQVYTAIATVYRMMEDQPKAIAELESLLQKGTDKSIGYVMLGELYLEQEEGEKAADVLLRGLEQFPDEPLIQIAMSETLLARGEVDEAYEYLSRGFSSAELDLDYKSGLIYRLMDESAYSKRQILTLADGLIDDYPTDARSHAVRGDIYAQYDEIDESRISYLKALEINRYIPPVWNQLMYLSFMREDWKEAQRTGKRAIELFPNDATLLMLTGNAFVMEGKNEEARPFLEAALNNTGEENTLFLAQIYAGLGGIYHALGMYPESDVAYKEALAIDSLDTFSLNNYAYYLAERNENLEEAKRMSALSMELRPNNSNSEDTYAWILYKMGEYKEALQWIKRAIKNDLNGPSAVLLEHYGDILFQNGKTREAVSQWKNALKVVDATEKSFERLTKKVQERRIVD